MCNVEMPKVGEFLRRVGVEDLSDRPVGLVCDSVAQRLRVEDRVDAVVTREQLLDGNERAELDGSVSQVEGDPDPPRLVAIGTWQGARMVHADGRRRRTHVLRIVLSHCRKAYSEAVDRQTTENFIRCWKTPSGTSVACLAHWSPIICAPR